MSHHLELNRPDIREVPLAFIIFCFSIVLLPKLKGLGENIYIPQVEFALKLSCSWRKRGSANELQCKACGHLPTPLVDGQTSRVYSNNAVQYLYISCCVTVNKPVLSYLLLRLLPQAGTYFRMILGIILVTFCLICLCSSFCCWCFDWCLLQVFCLFSLNYFCIRKGNGYTLYIAYCNIVHQPY